MSLTMHRASATTRIPVFNGEDGQSSFFKTRFVAAVCGLGGHYHAAMEGLSPYSSCTYTSNQITLSPFKTPTKGNQLQRRSKMNKLHKINIWRTIFKFRGI